MNSYFRSLLLSVVVVAFAGCANGVVGAGPKGELSTKLVIAPGIDESEINYTVTGNSIDPITGTVTIVSNPVEVLISGVPVGVGYSITLSTTDAKCTGTARFDVIENQTTTVTVPIQCSSTPPKRGNVDVTGQFILCPTITSMVVSPTTVDLGGTIHVSATAKNLGTGSLTYAWTATGGGSFADATAAKTSYQCSVSGAKTLTITVSTAGCTDDSLSIDVTCGGGGLCGNGVVDAGEACDTAIAAGQTGACPTSCTAPDSCTASTLTGSACTAKCVETPITTCSMTKDGCCPVNCTAANDGDCQGCGDGIVVPPETCDTAITSGTGACPTSCTAPHACMTSTLENAGTCMAKCTNVAITPCCGNGILETGENCDTAITSGTGACPTSCTAHDACTASALQGTGCAAKCVSTPITTCNKTKDGCCPANCTAATDGDCVGCGDGIVTAPETCDTAIAAGQAGACPTTCTPPNTCTTSSLKNAGTCTTTCVNAPITPCCGNGTVETAETCDTAIAAGQAGACPTTCTPPNTCTTSVLQNNHTCTAACANTSITACVNGDGCCPKGCNSTNDNDCRATCGNGVIETGEQCDPPVAGSCSDTCQNCIDLTGTWIARVTTVASFAAPNLLGDPLTDAALDFVLRMVVTKSGSAVNTRFDICSLSTSTPPTSGAQIDITYRPAVLATLTANGSTTTNVCPAAGGTVTFPTFTINSGWGGPPAPASNTCPVPANGTTSCSGAIDSDGDGIYGDTLPTSYNGGTFNLDLYAGLTLTVALNGMTLTNAATQSGAMNLTVVGYLYGSSLTAVSSDLNIAPIPNPVSMTAIKLTGNVPCATVLQHCSGATCVP